MSVILETSKGDIIVDLFVDDCPKTCENFLKLCKIKYYNNCLFYNVQQNFIAQTGDPTNTGRGGDSIWGVLYGEQARFFEDEIRPHLKHQKKGVVGMASIGENMNSSQFYITTRDELDSLDEKHTVFGEVAEGWEVLEAINDAPCDDDGRPLQNIRIRHTIVLEDPFDDPVALGEHIPAESPPPQYADDGRLEDDWVPTEDTRPPEEIEASNREKEARSRAVVLEMIGDLPDADAAPPENVLFICKLNPVTTEEDLEIIFSRFGTITSCDIIRDWKTGDSLCYGFIGFDSTAACEQAYFKMNNVLIDDRRIKVDFSQSVHHLWKQFRKFGKKGDVGLQREADEHERAGGGLELKEHLKPGMAGKQGNQRYDLLYEDTIRNDRNRDIDRNTKDSGLRSRHYEKDDYRSDRRHRGSRHRSRSREGPRHRSRNDHRDHRDYRDRNDEGRYRRRR